MPTKGTASSGTPKTIPLSTFPLPNKLVLYPREKVVEQTLRGYFVVYSKTGQPTV